MLVSDRESEADRALTLLRDEIIAGAIEPNTKLKVQHLSKRYGVGTTPLRDALTQLAATGLIVRSSQRGFHVPGLSQAKWADLMATREILETEALRLAVESPTAEWEDSIVSTFHLLAREIERLFQQDTNSIQKFWYRHVEFHAAVISACPLDNLKSLVATLYTRMIPYRRLTLTDEYSKKRLIQSHETLMRAVLDRDNELEAVMREHIRGNKDIIQQVMSKFGIIGDEGVTAGSRR